MIFSSSFFIFLFLPCVLLMYYFPLCKNIRYRNCILFLFSMLFYAWGEPVFVLILFLSIIIHWQVGLWIKKCSRRSKQLLILCIVFDCLLLFVFKYLSFLLNEVNGLLNTKGVILNIALPIGISFFTFQSISYVVDIYRDKAAPQKNMIDMGLYISFFPQLIAGPIVRYQTISQQISEREHNTSKYGGGVYRFAWGLGKKVLIADRVAVVADYCFGTGTPTLYSAWLGAIAYTLQIYYDFSGYSDMAIGLARMFGFEFEENFNYPYVAKSIREFWQRWHISLGSWFRDYVYIPLGGNRVSKQRLFINLLIVWALTGIWHGANWTFLVWGLMYFVLIYAENLFYSHTGKRMESRIYTMLFVVFGWVIFRSDSLSMAFRYIGNLFGMGNFGIWNTKTVSLGFSYWIYIVLGLAGISSHSRIKKHLAEHTVLYEILKLGAACIILILSLAAVINSVYSPFIYFNF